MEYFNKLSQTFPTWDVGFLAIFASAVATRRLMSWLTQLYSIPYVPNGRVFVKCRHLLELTLFWFVISQKFSVITWSCRAIGFFGVISMADLRRKKAKNGSKTGQKSRIVTKLGKSYDEKIASRSPSAPLLRVHKAK